MLKTYGLYFCITVAVLFVQTSVFLPWGNHGIRPDLLMFIVLWAAVSLPVVHSASIIVLIAFLFEALSGLTV